MPEIDPTWPWWLILLVVTTPVIITTVGVVTVAKINKQTKDQLAQGKLTAEVHDHVVNSHTDKNLRRDIDDLKSSIESVNDNVTRISLKLSDLNETQKSHGRSLERRYGLLEKSLSDAIEDRQRAIDETIRRHITNCPARRGGGQ